MIVQNHRERHNYYTVYTQPVNFGNATEEERYDQHSLNVVYATTGNRVLVSKR